MKDAKRLEQRAHHVVAAADQLAQQLLNDNTCERDGDSVVVLAMAMCMAGVAAGRAVELSDERLLAIFKNALERVKSVSVDMSKAADA